MPKDRAGVYVVHECSHCGEEFCAGECLEDPEDNKIFNGEDCSCALCHCMNETESGEVCSMCRSGAHQG